MRAERLGSYSMVATRAGTPSLSRLKSMRRYRRLCPPPRRPGEVGLYLLIAIVLHRPEEIFDALPMGERHDGLLPGGRIAAACPRALFFGPHGHLRLARRRQLRALLRDERAFQDSVQVHQSALLPACAGPPG